MSGENNDIERRKAKEEEAEANGGKKLPYPKSLIFIVGNEFCERFSYYGMKAILSIYIKNKLHFSEDSSTVVYHTFSLFCYFCPLFGAMLADQVLGKFKTIFYISIIYVLGHLLKTLAAVPTLGLPPVEFSLIGLALIAIGTGGIKPCVSAFGGDQFKLPEQERQLQTFFSIFYFAINSGALISTFVTPILRQDVHCFGDDTCYSLAFGVPAVLMLLATIFLVLGKPLYVMKAPEGNIMSKVFGAIGYAAKRKFTSGENREHWLDYAREKYDRFLVEDTKILLKVLVLYLPLPVFWALFDQMGSRWTFQATRMNGDMGWYVIKPDQMQVLNAVLILILIPLFDAVIYPFFAKFNFLKKPLQRITVGGLFAAGAFFISGFLELAMMPTYDRLPAHGESHLHVMNSLGCPISVRISNAEGTYSEKRELELRANEILYGINPGSYDFDVRVPESCVEVESYMMRFPFNAEDMEVTGVVVRSGDRKLQVVELQSPEEPKKSSGGDTKLRAVFDIGSAFNQTFTLRSISDSGMAYHIGTRDFNGDLQETAYEKVQPGSYDAYSGQTRLGQLDFGQGGVHTIFVSGNKDLGYEQTISDFRLTADNSINMFWLFPQYLVITMGEIMFSVTGLEFSYSQAPDSMKSVLQAAWLLTVAFGNLIVIIVAEAKALDQAAEFFMFAILMTVDMGIFAIMAYFYKYVDLSKRAEEEEEENMKMRQRSGIDNDAYGGSTDF